MFPKKIVFQRKGAYFSSFEIAYKKISTTTSRKMVVVCKTVCFGNNQLLSLCYTQGVFGFIKYKYFEIYVLLLWWCGMTRYFGSKKCPYTSQCSRMSDGILA